MLNKKERSMLCFKVDKLWQPEILIYVGKIHLLSSTMNNLAAVEFHVGKHCK